MTRIGAGTIFVFVTMLSFSFGLSAAQRPFASGYSDGVAQGRPPAAPTFTKDVAPILYKHCTHCHRAGEIGPMSLITYEETRPWARSIRDNVSKGLMPPWHADVTRGKFVNDRRLTDQERDTVVRWADAGAPRGDAKDLPPAPTYTTGWSIGKPDLIVTMPTAYKVPAQGTISYQYFEAETKLTEDKWVQAMEIRPGSRAHVHHVLVYVRDPSMLTAPRVPPPFRPINYPAPAAAAPTGTQAPRPPQPPAGSPAAGGTAQAAQTPQPAQGGAARRGPLFAGTAPGTDATILAPGTGMLLRAGSVVTFQIHYTSNGTEAEDRSSIGFIFATQPPTTELKVTAMINPRFVIPPGAEDHAVPSGFEIVEDMTIHRMVPHTHLRGKAWEYKVTYPDGRSEIVLSVPRYDFNWQTDYIFAEPLRLPKGSKLEAVARYDNSKNNKSNPDPTAEVRWGDQTWEEMQYTQIIFTLDQPRTTAQPR